MWRGLLHSAGDAWHGDGVVGWVGVVPVPPLTFTTTGTCPWWRPMALTVASALFVCVCVPRNLLAAKERHLS